MFFLLEGNVFISLKILCLLEIRNSPFEISEYIYNKLVVMTNMAILAAFSSLLVVLALTLDNYSIAKYW